MPRPPKKGLAYFPKDTDYYQDEKIVELAIKYGPLGLTTFDVLLTLIYREGYYIEMSTAKAAIYIVRIVGGNWYRKSGMSAIDFATEIIQYCAEIGLLDETLVRQDVMTSIGIQKRYAAVTARNKVDKTKYWLLDNNKVDAACESMPLPGINVAETRVSATETQVNEAKMQQRKENKIKVNNDVCMASGTSELSTVTTVASDNDNISDKISFILGEYTRLLPTLPEAENSAKLMCSVITANRPREEYTRLFERASRSSFLTTPKSDWKCNIEWLTDPVNMDKVLSGKYDDYKTKNQVKSGWNTKVNGVESGFDTEEFFKAALERGADKNAQKS